MPEGRLAVNGNPQGRRCVGGGTRTSGETRKRRTLCERSAQVGRALGTLGSALGPPPAREATFRAGQGKGSGAGTHACSLSMGAGACLGVRLLPPTGRAEAS